MMQIIQLPVDETSQATLTGYLQERNDKRQSQLCPAVIVVPGGSYTHIPKAQAEALTLAFNRLGFQSFTLRYSFIGEATPLLPRPVVELGRAIATIKQRASEWSIDANRIVVAGFSAGGHVAALFNDYWHTDWLNQLTQTTAKTLKPQAIMLAYPVISPLLGFPTDSETLLKWTDEPARFAAEQHVTNANRPTFIWATTDDPVVPVQNTLAYVSALNDYNVPVECHLFSHGPHGIALADQTTAWNAASNNPHVAHWLALFNEWYTQNSL